MLDKLKQLWKPKTTSGTLCVYSPLEGTVIPLAQVHDPAFSKGLLGKGFAVVPISGKVFAPFHGRVTQLFASNHAISLVSSEGIQVLIHVGIDTIKLNGQHFTPYTQTGRLVQKGDILLEFDLSAMVQKGMDIVSPLIVCNPTNFSQIELTKAAKVSPMDEVIWCRK